MEELIRELEVEMGAGLSLYDSQGATQKKTAWYAGRIYELRNLDNVVFSAEESEDGPS